MFTSPICNLSIKGGHTKRKRSLDKKCVDWRFLSGFIWIKMKLDLHSSIDVPLLVYLFSGWPNFAYFEKPIGELNRGWHTSASCSLMANRATWRATKTNLTQAHTRFLSLILAKGRSSPIATHKHKTLRFINPAIFEISHSKCGVVGNYHSRHDLCRSFTLLYLLFSGVTNSFFWLFV